MTTAFVSFKKEDQKLRALTAVESCLAEQLDMWLHDLDEDGPSFTFPNFKDPRNVTYDPVQGLVPVDHDSAILTTVYFTKQQTQKKYVRMMLVLNKIHQLLVNDERITKREMYYQLLCQDGGKMPMIDDAVLSLTG
jgi:DNA topoisomerase VI subunit A